MAGVRATAGDRHYGVRLAETNKSIAIASVPENVEFTVKEARRFADQLYRLADRVEARQQAGPKK